MAPSARRSQQQMQMHTAVRSHLVSTHRFLRRLLARQGRTWLCASLKRVKDTLPHVGGPHALFAGIESHDRVAQSAFCTVCRGPTSGCTACLPPGTTPALTRNDGLAALAHMGPTRPSKPSPKPFQIPALPEASSDLGARLSRYCWTKDSNTAHFLKDIGMHLVLRQ